MKHVFEVTGKDETTIKIKAEIVTKPFVLTAQEAKRLKVKLQNEIHKVLVQEFNYDVNQIKLR